MRKMALFILHVNSEMMCRMFRTDPCKCQGQHAVAGPTQFCLLLMQSVSSDLTQVSQGEVTYPHPSCLCPVCLVRCTPAALLTFLKFPPNSNVPVSTEGSHLLALAPQLCPAVSEQTRRAAPPRWLLPVSAGPTPTQAAGNPGLQVSS